MAELLENYWFIFSAEYLGHLIRYLSVAGFGYVLFYSFLRRKVLRRKIQELFPARSEVRREVMYSFVSLGIFSAVGVLTAFLQKAGWIQMYFNIQRHGWD